MGRIIPNENTWVGFIAALASTTSLAVTEADIDGCTDLTHWVISLNASSSGNVVPTPAFDTLFETSIVGTSTATFTGDFYRDDEADTAWETLKRGDDGFFLISRFGGSGADGVTPAATDHIEVWPATIVSKAMANMTNNTTMTFTLTCSVPQEPDEDVTVGA